MVGSVGLSLVQFRFNVGEVSVHVEDDVRFRCGSVWFSVGSGGSLDWLGFFSFLNKVVAKALYLSLRLRYQASKRIACISYAPNIAEESKNNQRYRY